MRAVTVCRVEYGRNTNDPMGMHAAGPRWEVMKNDLYHGGSSVLPLTTTTWNEGSFYVPDLWM